MDTTPWYVDFFIQDYAQLYAHLLTPERTAKEVAFLQRTLALQPGSRILDLCCGWGRHSIALAALGYQVVGLDLSPTHIQMARDEAQKQGVAVHFIQSDMRDVPFQEHFDAAINMFTAFGYLESDEEDQRVLQAVSRALKPAGRFLMDTINREWLVRNYQSRGWEAATPQGHLLLSERRLDLLSSRHHERQIVIDPAGSRRETAGHVLRLYTLAEMAGMLRRAGLHVAQTFGGFEDQEYSIDSRRMIILAQKGQ